MPYSPQTWTDGVSSASAARMTVIENGIAAAIPKDIIDAAGDLIVGSAADTSVRLARGSALQVLRVNSGGTNLEYATPTSSSTVYHSGASQSLASSTTLTSVLSQSIPGNTIGANGMVRVTIPIYLQVASTESFTWKISLGATTVFQLTIGGIGVANWLASLEFTIHNVNATNVQFLRGTGPSFGVAASAATTGLYGGSTDLLQFTSNGTVAVDTTSAQTLDVSLQHSVSNAGNIFTRYAWVVEVIP